LSKTILIASEIEILLCESAEDTCFVAPCNVEIGDREEEVRHITSLVSIGYRHANVNSVRNALELNGVASHCMCCYSSVVDLVERVDIVCTAAYGYEIEGGIAI
jgi:hypothetical protein